MRIEDWEGLLLGHILKEGDSVFTKQVVVELRSNRFINNAHRLIYSAIEDLIHTKQVPTIESVALQLRQNLDTCGGIPYLKMLTEQELNGNSASIVRRIDTAGQLNHVKKIVGKISDELADFEKVVTETEDVNQWIADVSKKISSSVDIKSGYTPISELCELELSEVKNAPKEITDLIDSGMSKLRDFMIPRPKSFGGILGMASTGKTSYALQLLIGTAHQLVANNQSGKVYFHSLDTPKERIPRRMACMLARLDSMIVSQRTWTKEQFNIYCIALRFLSTLPIEINDFLISSVEMKAQAIWSSFSCPRVLSISDFAEKFTDFAGKESEERRLNNIINNHREVVRETGSCEILLSQVGPEAIRAGSKIATWSDARYTRSFENDLDWGLVVWNPPAMDARNIKFECPQNRSRDIVYIFVQKNKDYKPGEIRYQWIPQYSAFRELELPINHLWLTEPWQMVEAEW